jgi:hypothetical protein
MSMFRSALCGVAAGAIGTVAMDLVWFVRYKRSGGQSTFVAWETASGLNSWDAASAPAKVGRLLYETVSHRELPASRAALTTNIMHWGYGLQWGALFGVSVGASGHARRWHGPLLGALVWLASYLTLPIAGFYKPIWSYDRKTLWDDCSAHLVYGIGVAGAFWRVCRS